MRSLNKQHQRTSHNCHENDADLALIIICCQKLYISPTHLTSTTAKNRYLTRQKVE